MVDVLGLIVVQARNVTSAGKVLLLENHSSTPTILQPLGKWKKKLFGSHEEF
jgi:hypothetical protein